MSLWTRGGREMLLPPCAQGLPPEPGNVGLPVVSLEEFRRACVGPFYGLKVRCQISPNISISDNEGGTGGETGLAEQSFTIPRTQITSGFELSQVVAKNFDPAHPTYPGWSWDGGTDSSSTGAVTVTQSVRTWNGVNFDDIVIANVGYGGLMFYRNGIGQVVMSWDGYFAGGANLGDAFQTAFNLWFYTKPAGISPEEYYGVPTPDPTIPPLFPNTTGTAEVEFAEVDTGCTVLGVPIYMKGICQSGEQVYTEGGYVETAGIGYSPNLIITEL